MAIDLPNSHSVALGNYWRGLSKQQKSGLAAAVDSKVAYLRQVFLYGKKPGAKMAKDLSDHTSFSASQFRPDIFGEHLGEDAA